MATSRSPLTRLLDRWDRWISGGWLRRAILDAAVREGLGRSSSTILSCRLEAVARPGWVQVFAFELEDPAHAPPSQRFGLLRDDGRQRSEVMLFPDEAARSRQFALWSEGLIVRRRTAPSRTRSVLLGLFGLVVAVALLGALVSALKNGAATP